LNRGGRLCRRDVPGNLDDVRLVVQASLVLKQRRAAFFRLVNQLGYSLPYQGQALDTIDVVDLYRQAEMAHPRLAGELAAVPHGLGPDVVVLLEHLMSLGSVQVPSAASHFSTKGFVTADLAWWTPWNTG
jgi:hypothetical protein